MIRKLERFIFPLFAILVFLLAYFQPLTSVDNYITDNLYSRMRQTNKDIILICVDDDTLDEYGNWNNWGRKKTAELIDFLYSNENNKPLAVGVDFVFQGEGVYSEDDNLLVEACAPEDRKIVMANSIAFKGKVFMVGGELKYNQYYVDSIQYPFAALKKVTIPGFTNSFISEDTVTRNTMNELSYSTTTLYSFPYQLAKIYADAKGVGIPKISTDAYGMFRFFYAGGSNSFTHISLKTVLDGKVPTSEFRNKLVLFGAYAPGMQDAYFPTSDISTTINGVEIHANIIQAILEGCTANVINRLLYAIILTVFAMAICLFAYSFKYTVLLFVPIIGLILHAFVGRILALYGIIIPQFYAIVVFGIMFAYIIIRQLYSESLKRKHTNELFSRYMDPGLVNQLTKDMHDTPDLNLGGQKKDVAVLFVDIRGFTTLSESVEPEEIVNILNEYFSLVTDCIFRHNGMIDKFIGDAAMAVFNAPIDQPDYEYQAACAGLDIVNGGVELSKHLFEKYGKHVAFGVGISCGPAVIGNIGCKTRMDFTAIGDTVNTSSRLEGAAKGGEVLISEFLYERIKDKFEIEDAGEISLKGKAKPVHTYRVLKVKGEE